VEFTILSHAGLLVRSQGTSLIVDPWLVGSAYWRSWWNYPRPSDAWREVTDLDYIYITHMHWDHFHGPSLRRLPSTATVLIPDAFFPRMKDDILDFGFRNVVEVPHGKTLRLGPGLEVTSWQFGLTLDTTLVMSDGRTTLMNMNDCKVSGRPLRQILRRHPSIDFVFRSHSSAQPYPFCVRAADAGELTYRVNEDYLREFAETARVTGARHAIPFASNHCFLHRDTWRFNATAVSPLDVKRHFDAHGPRDSECVVMVPGDSWSDRDGFTLKPHDFFENREEHLAAYAAEVASLLEETYRREEKARLTFAAFEAYFRPFMDSLPRLSRIVFTPVIAFQRSNRPGPWWVLDFERRRIYESPEAPENLAFRIDVHEAVLKDCIEKRLFATWTPSKRLHVDLEQGRVRDLLIFLQLLDLHEYGYFPLRNMLRWRFVSRWARRWREVGHYAGLLWTVARTRGDADPLRAFIPKISAASDGASRREPISCASLQGRSSR
jgi:UDP-MurNAc hydroxylase